MLRQKINITSLYKAKILILFILTFFQNKFFYFLLQNFKNSYSQVLQDLFVLYELDIKKRGVFIEIGGGDGKNISNTYLLEKKYYWKGLICEPDTRLHRKIKRNRRCKIVKNPIINSCKFVNFYQTSLYNSSIKNNKMAIKTKLAGLCLNHLLEKNFKQPIDYISIDTEGNEYSILKKFEFKKYKIKVFTIEHNFNKNRDRIYRLMSRNGYVRKYKYLSHMDDWYILSK